MLTKGGPQIILVIAHLTFIIFLLMQHISSAILLHFTTLLHECVHICLCTCTHIEYMCVTLLHVALPDVHIMNVCRKCYCVSLLYLLFFNIKLLKLQFVTTFTQYHSKHILYFFSTISSLLNTTAAIVLEEFVRPCRPNISDRRAAVASKIISLIMGVICIVLVLFAKQFGSSLLSVSISMLFLQCCSGKVKTKLFELDRCHYLLYYQKINASNLILKTVNFCIHIALDLVLN